MILSYSPMPDGLSLENIRNGFNINEFFDKICRDILKGLNESDINQGNNKKSNISTYIKTKETLEKVKKLLENLTRNESRLRSLHENVVNLLNETQDKMTAEKSVFKGVVNVLDRESEGLKDAFKNLDKLISNFGQTSARIGERLKRCHERQMKSEDALKQINYFQEFSMVKDKGDFNSLPGIFTDNSRLIEAAAASQRLLTLSSEIRSTKQFTSMDGEDTPYHGTFEYAKLKLDEYCNELERKVVDKFDYAANKKEIEVMKECASIMAELDREMKLAHRYICSRPMFLNIEEMSFDDIKSSGPDITQLQTVYRNILATVRQEVEVIKEVFPSPQEVMQLFIQRVMEQRVRSAMDELLVLPNEESGPEDVRNYIRLVADVYEKTHTLAINLERVTNNGLELKDMADGLFSEYLGDYPEIELTWLSGLYEKNKLENASKKLDPDTVMTLFTWNKEAVFRCKSVSLKAHLPTHLKQLFHSSTVHSANTGCLLEQVARHVMEGLMTCWESSEHGSRMAISVSSLPDMSKKSINQACVEFISAGIGHLLEGISKTTHIIKQLRNYYESTIESVVSPSIAETSECRSGLSAFGTAVEEKVLEYTDSSLKHLFLQIERILATEQKKSEFRPSGGFLGSGFDTPTDACILVCGILSALIESATANLEVQNLKAFLEEVGCVVSDILSNHITHFIFSPAGALKLKRDMAEYVDTYRMVDAPESIAQFEALLQLSNIFIVAPDSLVGLVDGSLRMNHREAMKYIALREDFKSAKVNGLALNQLFTSDMQDFKNT